MKIEIPAHRHRVGYILRGRPQRSKTKKVNPIDDPVHVDCVLPNGHIAGYAYPDENFDQLSQICVLKEKGLPGTVAFDYQFMDYFRNVDTAHSYQILSTVMLFKVSSRQAELFGDFWYQFQDDQEMTKAAPQYNKLFNNCSTLCYEAFKHARILEPGLISGLVNSIMTPNRLYNALHNKYSQMSDCDFTVETGYFGIAPDRATSGNKIMLERKQY